MDFSTMFIRYIILLLKRQVSSSRVDPAYLTLKRLGAAKCHGRSRPANAGKIGPGFSASRFHFEPDPLAHNDARAKFLTGEEL
jgi:hypothetical protein